MIESNVQQQQRDVASNQQPLSSGVLELEADLRVKCAVCDAVYAPSSPQLPLLQHAEGTLDTAFMHMCHFCFRCRRAACPQCWDEVHGVCGSCVQEAHLTFRAAVPPLDGLLFSPPSTQPRVRKQQASPNFVLVHPGRFYTVAQASPEIDTDPVVQPVSMQIVTPTEPELAPAGKESSLSVASPAKAALPEVLEAQPEQESAPRAGKEVKKARRLETTLTWVLLILLLVIVALIALAEYIPAVNTLVVRLTHIDIHAEIAYLVHIVQQLFKR